MKLVFSHFNAYKLLLSHSKYYLGSKTLTSVSTLRPYCGMHDILTPVVSSQIPKSCTAILPD